MNYFKIILDSLLVFLILALSFLEVTKDIGITEFANVVETMLGNDKRLHFVTGVIITLFLFRFLHRFYEFQYIKRLLLCTFLAITILLVAEFSQVLFPSRSFSIDDIFAGFFGVFSLFFVLLFHQLLIKINCKYNFIFKSRTKIQP